MTDTPLKSSGIITTVLRNMEIFNLEALFNLIRHLPYGRNSDRSNPALVLSELKGTCSSKHALVKMVAIENDLDEIKLMIGIYRMNQLNTSKIGDVLENTRLDYIPEAHCYLKINNERIDLTSPHSSFEQIKNDLIQEIEILPEQTGNYKIQYHKEFIVNWIREQNLPFSLEEVWSIREACINRLSS